MTNILNFPAPDPEQAINAYCDRLEAEAILPDPKGDNAVWAYAANEALQAFCHAAGKKRCKRGDFDTVADMMYALSHWCNRNNVRYDLVSCLVGNASNFDIDRKVQISWEDHAVALLRNRGWTVTKGE